jgi:hypothetical protein
MIDGVYDHDSKVRIYQERVIQHLWRSAELARKLGMRVDLDVRGATHTYFALNASKQLEEHVETRSIPQDIPPELFAELDELLAKSRGRDLRVEARLYLMQLIEAHFEAQAYWTEVPALARRELSSPQAGDEEVFRRVSAQRIERFRDWPGSTAEREAWLRDTANKEVSNFDERSFQASRHSLMERFPEFGHRLTFDVYKRALTAWPRRGGALPTGRKMDPKWTTLAKIMDALGLGPIKGNSLQQQWQKRFENVKGRAPGLNN